MAQVVSLVLVGCSDEPDVGGTTHGFHEQAIIGGTQAESGQFPSVVSLQSYGHLCGGTLISPDWVLTAGHCVFPDTASGGIDHVLSNTLSISGDSGETSRVFRVYRHPDFSDDLPFAPDHDIALVRLLHSSSATPTPLPPASVLARVRPLTSAQVVGWGVTDPESYESPSELMHVAVRLRTQRECHTTYGISITDNMLCAGKKSGGADACYGDSGGPLFVKVNGQQTQVGIVSAGFECGRPEWYGIYTRLSRYQAWLEETMARGDREFAEQATCARSCERDDAACVDGTGACSCSYEGCLAECFGVSGGCGSWPRGEGGLGSPLPPFVDGGLQLPSDAD